MRLLRRVVTTAGLPVALLVMMVLFTGPETAPALVPVPEYVTFIRDGALEQVLAGDTAATVLVGPASLPSEEPGFPAPLEVVAHWWAPDGTHVLVGVRSTVTGAQRLFICDHNGGSPVPVTAAPGLFTARGGVGNALWDNPLPVWSPDGRHIALTAFDGSAAFGEIYVVSLDGTGEIVGSGVEPAWSPDSTRIAYARVVPGASSLAEARPYISVGTLGGSSVDLGPGRAPVFSPEGHEVLYSTWTDGGDGFGDVEQLAITPADGGATRILTHYGPMDDSGGPPQISSHVWAPDGTKVYYLLGRRSDSLYVYEVGADGSYAEPVQVSGLATEYVLSLDGTRLVYTSGEVVEASFQTRQQVYARDLASCAEWPLTTDELADFTCSNPSVSSQDRYVAFEAALVPAGSVPADATTREAWVATLDGSHAWRCATDVRDVRSQPAYGTSVEADDGVTDDVGPMDDDHDPTRGGFFATIGDAIAAFFAWLAGLFD